jgi:hypothetical protein
MTHLAALLLIMMVGSFPATAEKDWKSLFNGKNLKGWESKNGKAIFTVENGAIVGRTVANEPNSFLCTKREYKDFVLEFEFFGSPTMNSGVMFRALSTADYKDYRVHGYQCELEDEGQDRDWSGGIYDEARRGWLYPMKGDEVLGKAFGEESKSIWKDGEWNLIRIRCEGDSIKTWVNGQQRANLKDGMTAKGFIGLQVHGVGDRKETMQVRWRNIRIKKL